MKRLIKKAFVGTLIAAFCAIASVCGIMVWNDASVEAKAETNSDAVDVVVEDFVMKEGASVRVVSDNVNGLRFGAEFSEETYNSLTSQNATYGMVIVPRDYITTGYELTVENLFGANAKYVSGEIESVPAGKKLMLNIDNLTPSDMDKDGRYEICAAITDIRTANLTREFVGVGYVKVNDEYILAQYYGNEMENNARSIYYVAQRAIEENDHASALQTKYIDVYNAYVEGLGKTYDRTYTVNYITTVNGRSTVETETLTAELNSEINLTAKEINGFKISSASTINSRIYANKDNVFNFYYVPDDSIVFDRVAWFHPQLDSSNNYDNATNDAIAKTMKDAGFTTVILAGAYNIVLENDANVQITRWVIDMFYRNGIKSIVCLPNWTDSENYKLDYLPDFSNHEGFAGFNMWDEPLPSEADLNTVAEYAEWYKTVYADVEGMEPFMINLNPSYCPNLGTDGYYESYTEYIKAYCDIVLSKFDDTNYEKFLSVDTYPIKRNGTLRDTFLYDMAVLKAYAMEYGTHMHIALQGCGWDDTPTDGNRADYDTAPTEDQMRLQMYTALAFGADSLSWWAYHPLDIVVDAPLNKDGTTTEVYNSIQSVNNELATFGSLYKNYTWKGVVMSSPNAGILGIGKDAQYQAYKKVKDEGVFSEYLLSASDTDSFSSINGSGSNHIVSIMKDADENEAFVAVNYSAVKDNKTLALTLTGKHDGAQYAIYKNGAMETVTIGTGGYTLKLAPGEGAFIVEASGEYNVTFKNWDGSVLQEETLAFGSVPTYKGEELTRERYTFAGWTPEIGAISGDTVYTALFNPVFETYTEGEKIGGEIGEYHLGDAEIPMTELNGKALHLEFKIVEDGSFSFAVVANDWANITGTLTITKSGDDVTAVINSNNVLYNDNFRIISLGDGWYAWEQNASAFVGDGAGRATEVGFIYSATPVTGTVMIDFTTLAVVDRFGTTFTNDEVIGGATGILLGANAVSMTELSGKAIHFEFKFETDGSFNICLLDNDWANVTGYFTVTKSGNSVTSTIGRIVDLGDGWYAWELNAKDFAGDGVGRAANIGLVYSTQGVSGTVMIDLTSFAAVDRFATTFTDGELICDPALAYQLGAYAIPMAELSGKAIHFEFKFETDGSFNICLLASDWANVTGYFTVTKSGNSVTSTIGRIVAFSDGWYAWELNAKDFAGDGASRAANIGLVYATEAVTGTVMIDFTSFAAVNMYRTGTTFTNGEVIGGATGILLGANAVSMTELNGKAIHFEFKFETDGSFNICLLDADWANVTGYFTVTKSGNSVTSTMGRIVDLGDGWYAWELNAKDFAGDGVGRAANIGLVYSTQGVSGTVMIDLTSFAAVDKYRTGTTFANGEVIGGATGILLGANAVSMTELSGKAIHFEFKFETDGSFNICLLDADWANVTGYFTVTKSGNSVTSTMGRIVDLGDGWYAWELNAKDFAGDGAGRAANIGLVYSTQGITGTVVVDLTSFAAVDKYRTGTTYTNGELIGGGEYYLGDAAIPMTELSGKALHFEFKFETDGSFNIALLASDWANVTGYIAIAKSGDTIAAEINSNDVLYNDNFRIISLGDGWYAWEQNASAFVGDGASRAANVGLVYSTEGVTGTVVIDLTSFSVVDAY